MKKYIGLISIIVLLFVVMSAAGKNVFSVARDDREGVAFFDTINCVGITGTALQISSDSATFLKAVIDTIIIDSGADSNVLYDDGTSFIINTDNQVVINSNYTISTGGKLGCPEINIDTINIGTGTDIKKIIKVNGHLAIICGTDTFWSAADTTNF